jgi:pimeloyl-ACP methyl ester carboxylesterase
MTITRLVLPFLLLMLPLHAVAEQVTLERDGLTLNASLEKSGNWPEGPVVLMTHGTLAHSGMEIMATLQELFAENDISSLAINLSLGIDDREQAMYDCPVTHSHRHTDALDEIDAWAGWLGQQGTKDIVLLGHSRGGNQTAWFAAEREAPLVTRVILVAPATWRLDYAVSDYEKRYQTPLSPIVKKARTMVSEGKGAVTLRNIGFIYCEDTSATAEAVASYYADDSRMNTPTLVPEIKKPVLVIAGSEDNVVAGLIEAMEPVASGDGVELAVIDGADHFFRDLYAEDVVDLSVEFISAE